jgi:hypothetical protein
LITFGGFSKRLPIENWLRVEDVRWLVHEAWQPEPASATAFEPLGRSFPDLLHTVDAVITKPGYGLFSEAACNGTPVLYVRREDWPEQDYLIEWLEINGRCREISDVALTAGRLRQALDELWQQPVPPAPCPVGAAEAVAMLLPWLTAGNRNA